MIKDLVHKIQRLVREDLLTREGLDWFKVIITLEKEGHSEYDVRRILKIEHNRYIDDAGALKPVIKV